MDGYSTHIPVLKKAIEVVPHSSCLEFGTGLYSTKLLAESFNLCTSIEMQSEEWFNKVKDNFPYVDIRCYIGPFAWKDKFKPDPYYDLIFVDGHGDSRWDCINWAYDYTNIIVIHDTEEPGYHLERVRRPLGWGKVDFTILRPWTSILFNLSVYKASDFNVSEDACKL